MAALEEINERICQGRYIASVRKLYHQRMSRRLRYVDTAIRSAVGVLSTCSFTVTLLAIPESPLVFSRTTTISLAFASMCVAVLLNVVPTTEAYRQYDELYRRWVGLCGRWENLETRLTTMTKTEAKESLDDFVREVTELTLERSYIESTEELTWSQLHDACRDRVDNELAGESTD